MNCHPDSSVTRRGVGNTINYYEGHRCVGYPVSINLTPEQQSVIQKAIKSGLVRSMDEFINSAMIALSRPDGGFDKQKARVAGERIREIRKGVTLDLRGMSIRELAHIGHKY
jgi:Arc/MetJ-type ribon-helix-helix transcriptional regulator